MISERRVRTNARGERGRRAARGFTLVEAIVALFLLGLILLLTAAIAGTSARATLSLLAEQRAVREIEAVLASIEAGALPAASAAYTPQLSSGTGPAQGLMLHVEAARGAGLRSRDDLIAVQVTARFAVLGAARERTASTMVYRPLVLEER